MKKLIRLSPTGIEYGDYAWNFASGCGNNLDGKCRGGGFNCWAYSITKRFEGHYPNGFKPTIYPEALCSPLYLKKPSRILCAFMGDLFWQCPEFDPQKMISVPIVPGLSHAEPLREQVFRTINQCPQHTFLFLTKQPQHLARWSPFPSNSWVGVTATDAEMCYEAMDSLYHIEAKKYVSFEPVLGRMNGGECDDTYRLDGMKAAGIGGVIIGAQTSPKKLPEWQWVREIINACDKAGIPVFLKHNLGLPKLNADGATPFYKRVPSGTMELRQELPVEQP